MNFIWKMMQASNTFIDNIANVVITAVNRTEKNKLMLSKHKDVGKSVIRVLT